MWFREDAKGPWGPRATALLAGGALLVAGCGSDDFENEPRPASPIELTAAIDDRDVSVSPSEIGAGLVNITVSNQTGEITRLSLEGPTSAATDEIVPGGTASIKTNLEEGEYEVAAGAEADIEPAELEVGPPRPSSQNELLLP